MQDQSLARAPNGLPLLGFTSLIDPERELNRCILLGYDEEKLSFEQNFEPDSLNEIPEDELYQNNLNYNNWATSMLVCHKVDSRGIKKDALYKPLFRKMRQYLHNLNKARNFSKFTPSQLRRHVWAFMHMIGIPDELMDLKGLHEMMLLLYPALHIKIVTKDRNYSELMLYYDLIVVSFYEIFKNNNIVMREIFFTNPLIKWLWEFVFIKMKPMLLVNHLRRIRSYPFEGEARFRSLLIDLKSLESSFTIRLLPSYCDDTKRIKVFNRDEAEKELRLSIDSTAKPSRK